MQQETCPPWHGIKGQVATRLSAFSPAHPLLSKSVCKISNSLRTFPFGCDHGLWVPGVCPAAGGRMWSHTSCACWLTGAQHTAPQSQPSTRRARKPCRKTRHEGCLGFPQLLHHLGSCPQAAQEFHSSTSRLQLVKSTSVHASQHTHCITRGSSIMPGCRPEGGAARVVETQPPDLSWGQRC